MLPKPDMAWRDIVEERRDWDFQELAGDGNMSIIRKCGLNIVTQGHDMSLVCVDVSSFVQCVAMMLLVAAGTNVTCSAVKRERGREKGYS